MYNPGFYIWTEISWQFSWPPSQDLGLANTGPAFPLIFHLDCKAPSTFVSSKVGKVSTPRDSLCKDQGLYLVFRIAYAGWLGNVSFFSTISQEIALPLRTSLYPGETVSHNVGLFLSPDCLFVSFFSSCLTLNQDFLTIMACELFFLLQMQGLFTYLLKKSQ